ncbi:hypothetical protein ACIKK6_05355, partial [Bacillus thuringiensis]
RCIIKKKNNKKKYLYKDIDINTVYNLKIYIADDIIIQHKTIIDNFTFGKGIAQMLNQHNN